MNLSYFFARRYFFSGKKSFINFIAIISMAVVGISSAALVIVLSVFNGLEGLLRNLYGDFDADLIVTPAVGKSFELNDSLRMVLNDHPGVVSITEVIEDNVLLKYKKSQRVVRLKGVSDEFEDQGRFTSAITNGSMALKEDSTGYAIVGRGIQYALGININDEFSGLQVFYPRDISPGQLNPERMFSMRQIQVNGIFAVEKYFDDNYVFVPIEFTRDLFGMETKRTALEIDINPDLRPATVKSEIAETLGDPYVVRTGEETHSGLYKILQWEKIFVFLTFGTVLAIGSVNIYFSLSMLVIEKSKDIAVLKSLGATDTLIKSVFLLEGCLIAFSGAIVGLTFGLLISFLQQQYGLVSMGVPGAISDAYPVIIKWVDIVLVAILIILITLLASIQPAIKASRSGRMELLQ